MQFQSVRKIINVTGIIKIEIFLRPGFKRMMFSLAII